MSHWSDPLEDACDEAVTFMREYPTPEEAWAACEDATWIGWLFRHWYERNTADYLMSLLPKSNTLTNLFITRNRQAAYEWAERMTDTHLEQPERKVAIAAFGWAREKYMDTLIEGVAYFHGVEAAKSAILRHMRFSEIKILFLEECYDGHKVSE
jgi:hypothetical protein